MNIDTDNLVYRALSELCKGSSTYQTPSRVAEHIKATLFKGEKYTPVIGRGTVLTSLERLASEGKVNGILIDRGRAKHPPERAYKLADNVPKIHASETEI